MEGRAGTQPGVPGRGCTERALLTREVGLPNGSRAWRVRVRATGPRLPGRGRWAGAEAGAEAPKSLWL